MHPSNTLAVESGRIITSQHWVWQRWLCRQQVFSHCTQSRSLWAVHPDNILRWESRHRLLWRYSKNGRRHRWEQRRCMGVTNRQCMCRVVGVEVVVGKLDVVANDVGDINIEEIRVVVVNVVRHLILEMGWQVGLSRVLRGKRLVPPF
jgi:hypothetical protein